MNIQLTPHVMQARHFETLPEAHVVADEIDEVTDVLYVLSLDVYLVRVRGMGFIKETGHSPRGQMLDATAGLPS